MCNEDPGSVAQTHSSVLPKRVRGMVLAWYWVLETNFTVFFGQLGSGIADGSTWVQVQALPLGTLGLEKVVSPLGYSAFLTIQWG